MREGKRGYFLRESVEEEQREHRLGRSSSREGRSKSKSKRMFAKKAKKRKKSSNSKSTSSKMAPGSETTALSPTVDNHKTVDVKHHIQIPQKFNKIMESPAPQQTTDESTDTGDEQDHFGGSDEQDENVNVAAESSYISDNDPYIYSDDSESFSDAYFRPQINDYPAVLYPRSTSHGSISSARDDHVGRRIPGGDDGPFISGHHPLPPSSSTPFHNLPSTHYGSLGSHQSSGDGTGSPFKLTGGIASIREDSPVDEEQQQLLDGDPAQHHQFYGGYHNKFNSTATGADVDAQYLRQTKKERRKQRKQQKAMARQRQMEMLQNQKQREQAVRERTVSEVKGRPQDEMVCRDSIYAYIFVAQLILVFALALRSGTAVMFSKGAPSWGTLTQPGSTSKTNPTIPLKHTNRRHLLERLFLETADFAPTLGRRLDASSPLLDTGKPLAKNASLSDVLLKKNDTQKLLTDDAITPRDDDDDQVITSPSSSSTSSSASSSSSSSSTMHKKHHMKKNVTSDPKSTATNSEGSFPSPTQPPSTTSIYSSDPTSFTIDYRNAIALIGVSGFYACILSYLSFGFMLIMSRALIQVTLVFSIILSVAWGMLGLSMDPYGIISIMGFGALLLTLGYTIFNWQRVPFASTNLHTALCAMRCTSDITLLGMAAILVAFAWCVVWAMAFIGSVDRFDPKQCTNESICVFEVPLIRFGIYGFFIVSFYWTNTVIKNVLRVTVASAIGTWWYYPQEISPVCSPAVGQPLLRSLSKSLGSICLGSLVSQAIQGIHLIGRCVCCMSSCRRHASPKSFFGNGPGDDDDDDDDEVTGEKGVPAASIGDVESSLATAAPASSATSPTSSNGVSGFGKRIRCFNRWSYTYIGMYGYAFCEGGEKAIQLFEAREWMEVVRDNLIQNVLLMASIVIGGSTGSFAVLAEEVDGYDFTTLHKPISTAFLIGSVLGFVLSNVLLLGVVGSAVNTILVCFAAGPFEFHRNHPRLSREMRDVWSQQVWEAPA